MLVHSLVSGGLPWLHLSKINGKYFTPKNPAQAELQRLIEDHSIVLAVGCAGTGKSFSSVGIALAYKRSKYVNDVIVCRPTVGAGESNGYLPGTLQEKLYPYMAPIYDCIGKIAPDAEVGSIPGYVKLVTFEHLRSYTFSDSFIIVDEAQNATLTQLELVMTRLGLGSKMIICGDPDQCDLPNGKSGLEIVMNMLLDNQDIPIVRFTASDNLRHPLVAMLVNMFAKYKATHKVKVK